MNEGQSFNCIYQLFMIWLSFSFTYRRCLFSISWYKGRYGWVKLSLLIRWRVNIQIFVVEIWMKVLYLQWRYFYEMLLISDLNCENGYWKTQRSACRYFDFISYSALLWLYFHRIEGESDRSGLHNRKKRKVRNILDL